jgi:hypothetical protein
MNDTTSTRRKRPPLRRAKRGGEPLFFADPASDTILSMVVTLSSEVWALRERLAALEAVQVRKGALSAGEIDGYEFTPDQEDVLAADRKEFIDSLFRALNEGPAPAMARARPAARTGKAPGRGKSKGKGKGSAKAGRNSRAQVARRR